MELTIPLPFLMFLLVSTSLTSSLSRSPFSCYSCDFEDPSCSNFHKLRSESPSKTMDCPYYTDRCVRINEGSTRNYDFVEGVTRGCMSLMQLRKNFPSDSTDGCRRTIDSSETIKNKSAGHGRWYYYCFCSQNQCNAGQDTQKICQLTLVMLIFGQLLQ